mmetsp:Transcript_27425/g.69164  ORF Transcript_27425/g.69164 Transcript_27425/m.69164 type:complete len:192 (-) Transcript_27425:212-787(-)|eukprot:g735.t1
MTTTNPHGDRVKWDEWTIAEHDKERGTRQKIDEPKTPFVTLEEAKAEAAASRAQDEQLQQQQGSTTSSGGGAPPAPKPLYPGDSMEILSLPVGPEDLMSKLNAVQQERDEEDEKKKRFEEHRKKHYNEGQRVKEMMARMTARGASIDDDSDEESEGEIERKRVLEENARKNAARNVPKEVVLGGSKNNSKE